MKRRANPTKILNKVNKTLHSKMVKLPDFKVGDTIKVHVKVAEGEKVRVQVFEGLVIAKRKTSLGGRFVVRKISYGIGVERIFQTNSPVIEKVTLVARGNVRRSKLYYLRELSGRSARIQSDQVFGADREASVAPAADTIDADPVIKAAVQA